MRSPERTTEVKPIAACWTVVSLSDMLDDVSSRTAKSIGVAVAAKYVMSCGTPSSAMAKSSARKPADEIAFPIGHDDAQRDEIDSAAEACRCLLSSAGRCQDHRD